MILKFVSNKSKETSPYDTNWVSISTRIFFQIIFYATLSLLVREKDIINIIILNNKFKQLKIGHCNLCIFSLI